MNKFQFAKLISKLAWQQFSPVNDASRLDFDWRVTKLALDKINKCDDDQLSHVLEDEKLAIEMAESYVRAWKYKVDNKISEG